MSLAFLICSVQNKIIRNPKIQGKANPSSAVRADERFVVYGERS